MNALDRAALAICIVRGKQWAALTATEQTLYREDARAVLVSLREPSEAMVAAGADQIDYDSDGGMIGGGEGNAYRVFQAMIKAAG